MKAVVQRVHRASVTVSEQVDQQIHKRLAGEISTGLLVYLGVADQDGPEQVQWLVEKIANLRVFADPVSHKTDLSVQDVGGSVLVISQFTLLADLAKGRRPSFSAAAAPAPAEALYTEFVTQLGAYVPVQTGVFGADMAVESINDGPFTLLLDRTADV